MSAGVHDSGVDAVAVFREMSSPGLALAFMTLVEALSSSSDDVRRKGLEFAKDWVEGHIHVLRDDSAPLSDVFLACEDDEIFHALFKADGSECISDLSRVLGLIDERLQALGGCDER